MDVCIPYRPNKLIMLGVILFFCVCGGVLGYIALEGKTGLSLFRIVSLEPNGASIAFWLMSSVCGVFVIFAIFAIYVSYRNPKSIVFSQSELKFPKKGFSKDHIVVRYDEISGVNEVSISGTYIYTVAHSSENIELTTSMVPGKKYYDQFKTELEIRVNG